MTAPATTAAQSTEPGGRGGWRRRFLGTMSPDFRRLWLGQGISEFGSYVTAVALPLVALGTLGAGASEMGALNALGRLPFLLYVFAGVFVDRVRRRPVLIGTDLANAVLMVSVAVAAVTGALNIWLLGTALLISMTLTVWFDTAYMSYLPSLVDRRELMASNTRLETTRSAAQVTGPSLGGVLVQVLTAPFALLVDAVSFVVSALFTARIRSTEPTPATARRGVGGVFADIWEGFRFLGTNPVLRPLAVAIGVSNLAWAAELALYMIFLVRGLDLPVSLIGITLAGAGPGTLVGSTLAGMASRRLGLAGAITGGLTLFSTAALLIPLTPRHAGIAVPTLIAAGFLMALGGQVCAVNVLTTRQSLTPDHLLGRVNASFRFLALGVSPLGALAGGYAGQVFGLRAGLFGAIALMFVAPLVVLLSPMRRVRTIEPVDGGAESTEPAAVPAPADPAPVPADPATAPTAPPGRAAEPGPAMKPGPATKPTPATEPGAVGDQHDEGTRA